MDDQGIHSVMICCDEGAGFSPRKRETEGVCDGYFMRCFQSTGVMPEFDIHVAMNGKTKRYKVLNSRFCGELVIGIEKSIEDLADVYRVGDAAVRRRCQEGFNEVVARFSSEVGDHCGGIEYLNGAS